MPIMPTAARRERVDRIQRTSPAKLPLVAVKTADGARVKQRRTERGWSLRHLAAHSGLAISTISKIENNRMTPTVDLFARLLAALDTTPGDWFLNPPAAASKAKAFVNIVRSPDHLTVEHPAVKREVLLGGAKHHGVLVMRLAFPPDAHGAEQKLAGHAGNELIYVIGGCLEFGLRGRKPVVLQAGDSVHFSSATPHRYKAHGGAACEVIMVWRKED